MKNTVPNENCLTEAQLLQYLRDECPTEEEKAVDRHLTICPLCSDALEGAMLLNVPRLERSLHRLDAKIETVYSDKTMQSKALPIVDEPLMTVVKKPRRLWLWAAASMAVIAAAGLWVLTKPMNYDIASPVVADLPTVPMPDSLLSQSQTATTTANETPLNTPKPTNGTTATPILTEQPTTTANDAVATTPTVDDKTASNLNTATTPNAPVTYGAPAAAKSAAPKAENTEGGTFAVKDATEQDKRKEETTKTADAAVVNAEKKAKQPTRQVQLPAPTSATQNYPGAAQNNVNSQSQGNGAVAKQAVEDGMGDYNLALRYYNKSNYGDAVTYFNRALGKQISSKAYNNTQWYLANSYLKLGKKQDALPLLQRIATSNSPFAKQAAELLK